MYECVYCSSQKTSFYVKVLGWNIRKCESCGVLSTDVKKNEGIQTNIRIYSDEYIRNYKHREAELRGRFYKHLFKIEQYKKGGKILDIGCGVGLFLAIVKNSSRYKWEINGLETNRKLISQAVSEVKSKIKLGKVEKIPFNSNYFDCVTCFDVLEHSLALENNIREIRRVLKDKGILIIQAPNWRSLMAYLTGENWPWWSPPDHVLHFSFLFLTSYLKENGFKILKSSTYEPTEDFLINIKGTWGKNILNKTLIRIATPLLLLSEKIAWRLNYGALSYVIAQKN